MARSRSSLKSKSKPAKSARAKSARTTRVAAPAKKTAKKAARSKRWVYAFGGGKAEGKPGMRSLLGGKGAGLAEMANLGLPVPPGFTIPTEVCTYYYANTYPAALENQV
jgi:pyruvate,orthophosphate dikinase